MGCYLRSDQAPFPRRLRAYGKGYSLHRLSDYDQQAGPFSGVILYVSSMFVLNRDLFREVLEIVRRKALSNGHYFRSILFLVEL